jgi:cation transporter-like permease
MAAPAARRRLDPAARNALVAATAWAVALVPAALWLPVATVTTDRPGPQPMQSLVAHIGAGGLLLAAVPLAVSVLVGACLRRGRANPNGPAIPFAWAAAGTLAVAALVGTVTILIGVYVLPTPVLLLAACGLGTRTE